MGNINPSFEKSAAIYSVFHVIAAVFLASLGNVIQLAASVCEPQTDRKSYGLTPNATA